MKGPALVLLTAVLAALALLAVAGEARRRALLRAPGSFPAVALTPEGRRRRVIGRYDERELVLHALLPVGRPSWRGDRCALELARVDEPGDPTAGVALDVRGGRTPVRLLVDPAVAGALRAWAEAGPSQAGQPWWSAAEVAPRRRR